MRKKPVCVSKICEEILNIYVSTSAIFRFYEAYILSEEIRTIYVN